MTKYSASGVKFLLWFVEMRETIRLLETHPVEEARCIVIEQNVYRQKDRRRRVSEFGCILQRIQAVPKELSQLMLRADINTAKLIALIESMAADRLLFELIYEVFREKLRLGEEELRASDLNVFFSAKAAQSPEVARWSDGTMRKLSQTYGRFMLEAGIVKMSDKKTKLVVKPYMDPMLREVLIRSSMERYLYALTGEK